MCGCITTVCRDRTQKLNFFLRQPTGGQLSISFHALVLTLLPTFPHQCMFNFLQDALQKGEVKLSFRVRHRCQAILGDWQQHSPSVQLWLHWEESSFSVQDSERKGEDEKGREREHFRLVIQLQHSKSICCSSEACLFSQEQRNESNDGVAAELEPTVRSQMQHGAGRGGYHTSIFLDTGSNPALCPSHPAHR